MTEWEVFIVPLRKGTGRVTSFCSSKPQPLTCEPGSPRSGGEAPFYPLPLTGRSELPSPAGVDKAQQTLDTLPGGSCLCHPHLVLPKRKKTGPCHRFRPQNPKNPHRATFCFKALHLTRQQHGLGRCKSSLGLSTSPRSQLQTHKCQLANRLSRGLGCAWVVLYFTSSIRAHLHAEVWSFRPFKVNSLQYVNQLLSQRSSWRELGSKESRSSSASGGMKGLLPHVCLGSPHAQDIPAVSSAPS